MFAFKISLCKRDIYLDQAMIFSVIQVFPCTLFPVLIKRSIMSPRGPTLSALPLWAGRALDSRFSLGAIISIDTRDSWWSSWSSFPCHLWIRRGHHDHHALVPQDSQACRAFQEYHHNRKEEVSDFGFEKKNSEILMKSFATFLKPWQLQMGSEIYRILA